MLDVVLIQLIAAGLERICRTPGDGARVAWDEIAGEQLIRELTAAAPDKTAALISSVVEHVWQRCRAVGLPADIAEPHLVALRGLIAQAYVRAADQAIFLEPDGGQDESTREQTVVEFGQRIIALDDQNLIADGTVSYTHLTLPTICSV